MPYGKGSKRAGTKSGGGSRMKSYGQGKCPIMMKSPIKEMTAAQRKALAIGVADFGSTIGSTISNANPYPVINKKRA